MLRVKTKINDICFLAIVF